MLTLALLITQLFVLGILTLGICGYIRLGLQMRNMIRRFVNMELDDTIDDLLDADDVTLWPNRQRAGQAWKQHIVSVARTLGRLIRSINSSENVWLH